MRHKVAGRRLGRGTNERKMLRRNLMTQLFQHEKIKTTEAKAKAIKGQAEKLITLARNRGDVTRIVELVEDQKEDELRTILTDAQTRRLMALEGDDLVREARAIVAHAQRLVAREITDRAVLNKLFTDIAPRYVGRPGGYTRIVRLGQRNGDAAQMVQLSLVEGES
jgi:large subunit ribosomal protein L17